MHANIFWHDIYMIYSLYNFLINFHLIELQELTYQQLSYILKNTPDDSEELEVFIKEILLNGVPNYNEDNEKKKKSLSIHSILNFNYSQDQVANKIRVILPLCKVWLSIFNFISQSY